MIVFPAVNLYGGRAVRLVNGNFAKMSVYSYNPLRLIDTFREWR